MRACGIECCVECASEPSLQSIAVECTNELSLDSISEWGARSAARCCHRPVEEPPSVHLHRRAPSGDVCSLMCTRPGYRDRWYKAVKYNLAGDNNRRYRLYRDSDFCSRPPRGPRHCCTHDILVQTQWPDVLTDECGLGVAYKLQRRPQLLLAWRGRLGHGRRSRPHLRGPLARLSERTKRMPTSP